MPRAGCTALSAALARPRATRGLCAALGNPWKELDALENLGRPDPLQPLMNLGVGLDPSQPS